MGRLIDADALLNEFNPDSDALIDNILARMRIAKQPTDYDIGKVVEELEERKGEREKQYKMASMEDGSYMLSKCFSEGARAYGKAIEIGKQGIVF